jgi:hypothetical protein
LWNIHLEATVPTLNGIFLIEWRSEESGKPKEHTTENWLKVQPIILAQHCILHFFGEDTVNVVFETRCSSHGHQALPPLG